MYLIFIYGVIIILFGVGVLASTQGDISGWIAIGFGIVVIVISWVINHLTQKSKPFAAYEGALFGIDAVKDTVKSIFN